MTLGGRWEGSDRIAPDDPRAKREAVPGGLWVLEGCLPDLLGSAHQRMGHVALIPIHSCTDPAGIFAYGLQ